MINQFPGVTCVYMVPDLTKKTKIIQKNFIKPKPLSKKEKKKRKEAKRNKFAALREYQTLTMKSIGPR